MLINVEELVPQHIGKIYQTILKGGYINENSSKNGNAELYEAIVSRESELRAYFKPLGYALMKREGLSLLSRITLTPGGGEPAGTNLGDVIW